MSDHKISFIPHGKSVQIPSGISLLEAASRAEIAINNVCGGEGLCGRCKMRVKEGEVEGGVSGKLTREEIQDGLVLSCLTFPKSDLVVEIPKETLAKERRKADEDADRFRDMRPVTNPSKGRTSPLVRKTYLELDQPSLSSNFADHQRVCTEIRKKLNVKSTQTGLKIIKALPDILRSSDYKVTATVGIRGDIAEVMDIEKGNTEDKNYLVVVDIGTTTVVAHLVDANTAQTLDAKACFNGQGVYGREVTTRLISAEKRGGDLLQKVIIDDINSLIHQLVSACNLNEKDITAVVCAGNTVMEHFLLGLPTHHIRRMPYIATSVEPPPLRAAEVGIQIHPRGLLYALPGIGAWVGSDLTAGILATEMSEKDEIALLVDIGTNGEVVVGNKDWLMACSASAGPSLEGASVECGMRAEKGAVERVYTLEDRILFRTIGNAPARGICGSGIIDLVAVLLRMNIISRSGKFIDGSSNRVVDVNGTKRFVLSDEDPETHKAVYMTETDIENIITAKAAIYSAIRILLRRVEIPLSQVDRFYIAGAFGSYIDIENAVQIGLIPNLDRKKMIYAGNTSIQGAKIVALYEEAFQKVISIEKNTTYYDLMGADDYMDEFRKALFLPHTDIEHFTAQAGSEEKPWLAA